MFCKYCGAELESDAIFCTSCGKRIEAPAAEKAESHEQEAADTTAQQPQQARPQPEQAQRQEPQKSASASPEGDVWDKASIVRAKLKELRAKYWGVARSGEYPETSAQCPALGLCK